MIGLRLHGGLAFAALMMLAPPAAARDEPVASTPHFTFYSDFDANLNDALIAAGAARRARVPELFGVGAEKACFDDLPQSERDGWQRAVDYYAESVSSAGEFDRPQALLRLELAFGSHDWAQGDARRFIDTALDFHRAAAAAYERCRWSTQDAQNRRWIEGAVALLTIYEAPLTARLTELFGTAYEGLPFTVDAVETVSWAHANSVNLDPPGLHVMISTAYTGNQGPAALELVLHESAHFLTGRGKLLPLVLDSAAAAAGLTAPFRGDVTHFVHFYMVGEAVRRSLAATAVPTSYTPYLYAEELCGSRLFCTAIERTWPAYMDGDASLEEAAADLIDALNEPLADFLYDPFDPPIGHSIVIGDARTRVVERFGDPATVLEETKQDRRDPTKMIDHVTLSYSGLSISLAGIAGSNDMSISRMVLDDDERGLKYGLGIGSTRAEIEAVFERTPVIKDPYRLHSEFTDIRYDHPDRPGEPVSVTTSTELIIDFDENGRATRMIWEHYAD